jgi:hypothetical protein
MWLRLLRGLTTASPDWLVWKNVESALTGEGDVDSVAPEVAWPSMVRTFAEWAAGEGLGPVVVCPHAPGLLHLVALAPREDLFFELELSRRKVFLGSTLFRPADLLPLSRMDPQGYRRLRPGSEGVLKLVLNGMARGARVRWDGIARKRIRQLLADDPEGARLASRFFGLAGPALRRGVGAVVDGHWDRPAMLFVELWCLLRSVREPRSIAWRLRFRRNRVRCPVLRTILFDRRRVPLQRRAAWLAEVASDHDHRVIDPRDLRGTLGG